jgi:hypothetical protein
MGVATFEQKPLPTGDNRHWPAGFQAVTVNGAHGVIGVLTLSNSYETGGDTLDLSTIPLSEVTGIAQLGIPNLNGTGITLEVDSDDVGVAVSKIVAYDSSGEVANTTNLSANEFWVLILGLV